MKRRIWALFVALDSTQPVAEGTCLIKGRLDARMGRFRRDENIGSLFSLNDPIVRCCKDLIAGFRTAATQRAKGLQQALWHFGRACVAALPRDILLESAIGLDSLLVPGGGDSQYRFCLHGTVILSSSADSSKDLYKVLQEIYNKRSKAAHGTKIKEIEQLALECRQKLATAIQRIVELILNNQLPDGEDIALSVQKYVLKKATAPPS